MAISILFLTVIDAVFIYGFKFEIQNSILEFLFRFGVRIICIPLIAGISYEVLHAAAKSDGWFAKVVRAPGMGLQLITTKEPTEDMLEVAIAAFYIAMGERSCDYYNKLADEPENPQPDDAAEPHENAEAAAAAEKLNAPKMRNLKQKRKRRPRRNDNSRCRCTCPKGAR